MNQERTFHFSRKILFMVGILAVLFSTAAAAWAYQANQPKEVQFVHNGKLQLVKTESENVEQFLTEHSVKLDSYDAVSPSPKEKIVDGMQIAYTDQWPVTVRIGNQVKHFITDHKTAGELLKEQNISIGKEDKTDFSLNDQLEPGKVLTITQVTHKLVKAEQAVPFREVKKQDLLLPKGKEKVIQEGRKGKAVNTFDVVYENGKEVSRKLKSTSVVQSVQDRIVAIGALITVSRGGAHFVPRRVLKNVVLTAYGPGPGSTGKGPGDPSYAVTATGRKAQEGRTIAVDPRTIPLGSWVYIEGQGYRRAEDTGGAIKGNKIDIFFNDDSEAMRFGRRHAPKVYVIGPNKP